MNVNPTDNKSMTRPRRKKTVLFHDKQLHQIFEKRVLESPDRIAVREGDQKITYSELNDRADTLAGRLRSLGVRGDVLVGLCVDRGIEMIVGLLSILKAGGAYLPIDPGYPKKRIDFLVADSGAAIVVTVSRVLGCLSGSSATLVRVDEEFSPPSDNGHNSPDKVAENGGNLAYVMYTSGSSGTPKGVLIEHRNVVRLFEQTDPWFHFSRQDIWLMFHSISFDFSVWEIWGALLYGGTLVIVPSAVTRSPEQLQDLIVREKVTVLCQTPSAFQQFVAADFHNANGPGYPLRLIIFGGEALDLRTLRPWAERHGLREPVLVNMYGITETTVHVTFKQIGEQDLERTALNLIGTPIADLRVHLLGETAQPVPDGTAGEIYVSGPGVARGYLNRAELTAERFVVASDGTRMYRSGDRAMRLPDGELAYLGRTDDQFKVRGFRIEPREIELCLAEHPAVSSVSVLARDYGEGDTRLLAFAVAGPGVELTPTMIQRISADLADRAASELPPHMRPSACFVLREFPITPHGKIDRDELLRLATVEEGRNGASAEPMTPTEQAVARIWEDIMQRRNIGRDDDFFDLGGASLALMRILVRVNDHFGVRLNGSEMGELASIACLSACVEDAQKNHELQTQELQIVEGK
jgi:amino acid adenylation domain-containing protein